MIQITEKTKLPLLSLGFRPFFLVATLAAIALVSAWIFFYKSGANFGQFYYGYTTWHAHEMVFGYTSAIIAGFLLTAVGNWTGKPTATGTALLLLTLLWAAGRIAPYFPLPTWLIASIDWLFLPILSLVLLKPLILGQHYKNLIMVAILWLLAFANGLVHAEQLQLWQNTARTGISMGVDTVILLIIVIAGRVVPFFTRAVIPDADPKSQPWLEAIAISSGLALIASDLNWISGQWVPYLFFGFAITHVIRAANWMHPDIKQHPMLWSIYSALAWISIAFVLKGLTLQHIVWPMLSTHALTVGVIGIITVAMLTRVSLGHTGRAMQANTLLSLAFIAINLAAINRVILPLFWPQMYAQWVVLSGGLWVAAFCLIAIQFLPIWIKPRVS